MDLIVPETDQDAREKRKSNAEMIRVRSNPKTEALEALLEGLKGGVHRRMRDARCEWTLTSVTVAEC